MKTKTIHRSRLTKNFTTLPNELLQNDSLSHLALGLLCRMLSMPPDWETNLEWIYQTRKEGKEGMQTAIKELEALGYLKRSRLRPEGGKMGKMLWEWFDSPAAVIPAAGLPAEGNRPTTKDTVKKGVRSPRSSEVREKGTKDTKGGLVPKRTEFSVVKNFKPRYPYPRSEEEMVHEIEIRGYEPNLDYDGNFFTEFQTRNWRMPNGNPVFDWFELYQSRVLKTTGERLTACEEGGF